MKRETALLSFLRAGVARAASIAVLLFSVAAAARAAAPAAINYQGKLTDPSGSPLTGAYAMDFAIYDDDDAGVALHNESHPGVGVVNGVFHVVLSPPAAALQGGADRYLQVRVNGTALRPRQRLAAAPYALAVAADSVDTAELKDGAVTDGKVAGVDWGKLRNVPGGFADGLDSGGVAVSVDAGAPLAVSTLNFSGAVFDVVPNGARADVSLDASSVTLQGNRVNTANGLLRLDAGGQVPSGSVAGPYTGITGVGTLSSLSSDQATIGTGNWFGVTMEVMGADPFPGATLGGLAVGQATALLFSTSAPGADVGPVLGFGGYNGTGYNLFGAVKGAKEVSAAGDADGYLGFYTRRGLSFAERMRIRSAGEVGIGTPDPGGLLQVGDHLSEAALILQPGLPWATLLTRRGAAGVVPVMGFTDNHVHIHPSGGANGTPDGLHVVGLSVGVGTASPGQRLDVAGGNGRVESGFGWLTSSDRRYKKNISTLEGALEGVLALRGVRYDLKEDPSTPGSRGRHIGFIAQEMEGRFPELVVTDEKGMKSVAYDKMTAVLLEAVKSQQRQTLPLR